MDHKLRQRFSPRFLRDLAGESSSSHENDALEDSADEHHLGAKILIICFGVIALVAFLVFLFKRWQLKKREEQQARFLRLFEEDGELEVELGLRD